MRLIFFICTVVILQSCFFQSFCAEKAEKDKSEKAGSMLAVRNKVEAVIESNSTRALKPRDNIYKNETVLTRKRSRAQMMFIDKSVVGLGPDSEININEYLYNSKDKSGKLKINVKNGSFRILGGALSKSEKGEIEVKTPVATCGIRGSMLIGSYSAATRTLIVAPLAGTMTVRTTTGKKFKVTAKAEHGKVRGVAIVQPQIKKKKEEAKKEEAQGDEEAAEDAEQATEEGEDEAGIETAEAEGDDSEGTKDLSSSELSSVNAASGSSDSDSSSESSDAEGAEDSTVEISQDKLLAGASEITSDNDGTEDGDDDNDGGGDVVVFFHPDISVALDAIRNYNITVTDAGTKHALDVAEQVTGGGAAVYKTREDFSAWWDGEKPTDPNFQDIMGMPQYGLDRAGVTLQIIRNKTYSDFNNPADSLYLKRKYTPADNNYFTESDFNRIKDHTSNATNLNLGSVSVSDFR